MTLPQRVPFPAKYETCGQTLLPRDTGWNGPHIDGQSVTVTMCGSRFDFVIIKKKVDIRISTFIIFMEVFFETVVD